MRYFYRVIVGLLIALLAGASMAVPKITQFRATIVSPEQWFDTAVLACDSGYAVRQAAWSTPPWSVQKGTPYTSGGPPVNNCAVNRYNDGALYGTQDFSLYNRFSCPNGYSQDPASASNCVLTCQAGYSVVNGVCKPTDATICKDAQSLYNSTLGERYTDVEMPGAVSSGTSLCVPSSFPSQSGGELKCTMNFERDISFQDSAGAWVSRGTLDMGGMSGNYQTLPCGGSTTIPQVAKTDLNPPCPAGDQAGTVNGATVCKPRGPDSTSTTTDSKTDKSGVGTTETITTCQGANCTTTTVSKDTAGNVTGTDSKTTTKDNYCVLNPGSAQCGNAASGGSGGGSSDGNCVPGDTTAGCAALGSMPAVIPVVNVDKPMTITKDTGWGPANGSCPAPRAINLSFTTLHMPFDLLCQFASGVRPLVLGLAYLGAAFTFFGIGRKT